MVYQDSVVKYIRVKVDSDVTALRTQMRLYTCGNQSLLQARTVTAQSWNMCIVIETPKVLILSDFADDLRVQEKHISDEVLAVLLYGFLEALEYLEKENLVHGDVKLANMCIGDVESTQIRPMLLDYDKADEKQSVEEYIEKNKVSPAAQKTLFYGRNDDNMDNVEAVFDVRFDVFALFLSILMLMLGNQHPVHLLAWMNDTIQGMHATSENSRNPLLKEFDFTEVCMDKNILEGLEYHEVLRIENPEARSVLMQMGEKWDERFLPSQALAALPTPEDKLALRSLVENVYGPAYVAGSEPMSAPVSAPAAPAGDAPECA